MGLPVEAKLCEGEEVALIGGGYSAGQAVVFLAPKVKRLHLIVRGPGLEVSMSRYLIERIAALTNVVLHTGTEVTALEGDEKAGLTGATLRKRATGREPYLSAASPVPLHRRRSKCLVAQRLCRCRRQRIRDHRRNWR